MENLYTKNNLKFTLIWIIIYIVGASVCDALSAYIGIEKCITVAFMLGISIFLIIYVLKNNLNSEFGLCKPQQKAKYFLYYIPLAILISVNCWFGLSLNYSVLETILYVISMLCVGFIEELIFRGFLFKTLQKNNLKVAVIVSSVTFGFGHIINLFTGANLVNTICQIFYAIAVGFLFVIIFYKSKSLLPCIITHSLVNALSAFDNTSKLSPTMHIIVSVIIMAIAIVYSLVIIKTTKNTTVEQQNKA